jgi:23S rRNA (cytidine2498-2'-O)-methyltransferase
MNQDDQPDSPREALSWGLVALCRAGFEKELAGELDGFARGLGMEGFVRAKEGTAFAVFESHEGVPLDELLLHCDWH